MAKLYGCLVLIAACNYPALPAVTGHGDQTDAPEGPGPGIDAAAIDAAAIDAPDGSTTPTPRVDVTIDPTLATELLTSNPIAIKVKASDGFEGTVGLTAEALDGAGAAIPGWTPSLQAASVEVPLNGTVNTSVTLSLAAKKTLLTGSVKVTATAAGTVGVHTATTAVTVTDQVTFPVKVDPINMVCVYPATGGTTAAPVVIGLTTKVRWFNNGNMAWSIHASGVIAHQADTTAPGMAYEQVPTGAGDVPWYCHSPGANLGASNPQINVRP